jgi:hypothetical protein
MTKRTAIGVALPLCLLLAGGCATPSDPGARESGAPDAAISVPPQAAASAVPSANPAAIGTPSPNSIAPAAVEVSPPEVRVGDLVLSLVFEPARHMVDQAAVFNASLAPPATPTASDTASQGAVVLNDMVRVTNNLDPTQPVPADSAQSILRHVVIRVRSGADVQAVPYLGVSLDLLLDGHPVGFGQSAVPMVPANADPPRLYYGNNVRLGQRGTYQVFVRLSRNMLLGKEQPQAAQFNVSVR